MRSADQQPLMRKDRERLLKRQEIMRAARLVFAMRGYESATLDEIAEKAEFAKGTLYNYFDSKETLFREIVETVLNDVVRLAENTLNESGSVKEQFHSFALQMISYYKANEDLLRILTRELNRIQLERELTHMVNHAQRIAAVLASALRREIHKKAIIKEDPLELANMFISMIHDRVMRRLLQQHDLVRLNAKKESAFVVRLFFDGAALP